MKPKLIPIILFCVIAGQLKAQTLNNIFEDVKKIKGLVSLPKNGPLTIADKDTAAWDAIVKKYIPIENQKTPAAILTYVKNNPFITASGLFASESKKDTSKGGEEEMLISHKYTDFEALLTLQTPASVATPSSPAGGFTGVADQLTQLIIERAKQELTATFFQNLQKELKNNPELSAAFPKTLAFIGQIEPYLYASYLTTLRQAFFTDVNNFPFQLGAILRTPRIKKFMAQNPTANDVWLAVPVLEFIGDMHNGKSLPDAIKILYPDQELYAISPGYYNVLKLTVVLSESVRDVTGTKNWIDENTLETAYSDPVENPFFFAMLFESTKYLLKGTDGKSTYANNYITVDNIIAVKALLTNFTSDYNDANELATAYAAIKKGSKAGTPITFAQVTSLLSATETDLKATFDNINKLAPLSEKFVGTTDAFFDDFSQLIVILGDFNNKNYSSGVMNSMLLINQYIQQQKVKITPFTKQTYFTKVSTNTPNVSIAVQVALDSLTNYYVRYPNDNINSLIKKLQTAKSKLSSPPTADQLIAINKLYDKIQLHNYTITASDTNHYDANNMIQKLLKYATLMASLADAKTSADVNAALDAAILPVGSSSIKYYTAFSFSLNSYIGGAYYHSTYNYFNTAPKPGESLKFNTLGVALPIGLNFSVSTRWPPIGAVSAFISVVDLGAIASYRLNNPPNSSNQTLPAFTFQNLLAPGGFIMLNRIGNTPLAFGLGIQHAPQLTSITNGSTDLTTDPKWRIGAFISVDIPLFDLYSSSLKRPITN